MDSTYFPLIAEMIDKVYEEFKAGEFKTFKECFKNHLVVNKYAPMLQLKQNFNDNNLFLLHNTYTRDDVSHFEQLYKEARSVIFDVTKPSGNNIVVSLADKTPTRMTMEEYKAIEKEDDIWEIGYEGTMAFVYCHNDVWHFGTTTVPDINHSRYKHPTKTHGEMLDDALANCFPDVPTENLRAIFTQNLSPEKTYCFLIIHHLNSHIMDYTPSYGENYARLFHLYTRVKTDKGSTTTYEDSMSVSTNLGPIGVMYADYLTREQIEEEVEKPTTYAVMVRTSNNEMYKICKKEIIERETKDRGNSNVWINMLSVYIQRKPDYKVSNYLTEFHAETKASLTMKDTVGREYDPTYIIHEVVRCMTESLYTHYRTTTHYNKYTKRYKRLDIAAEQALAPIIRFHLAQLREIQIGAHADAPITPKTIRDYLCFHQTIKNLRLLIHHFNKVYNNQPATRDNRSTACFSFLNVLLIG